MESILYAEAAEATEDGYLWGGWVFILGWGLWILGIYEEAGFFSVEVGACGSGYRLGWIVLKIWFFLGEIGFWGTGCIMGGLLGFHLEKRMGRMRAE